MSKIETSVDGSKTLTRRKAARIVEGRHWTEPDAWRLFAAYVHAALGLGKTAPTVETILAFLGVRVGIAPHWLFLYESHKRGTVMEAKSHEALTRVEDDGTVSIAIADDVNDIMREWHVHSAIAIRVIWLLGAQIETDDRCSGVPESDALISGTRGLPLDLESVHRTIAALLLVPEGMVRELIGDQRLDRGDDANTCTVYQRVDALAEALERRTHAGRAAGFALDPFITKNGIADIESVGINARQVAIERLGEELEEDAAQAAE